MVTRHAIRSALQHDFDILGKAILVTLAVGFVLFAVAGAVVDVVRVAH